MTGLTIRARIAGGSLLIALVISVAAGIVIDSQVERIVREGSMAVLVSDSEPYVVALQNEPGERFDAPGPAQHVAVVGPDGSAPVDTLPAKLSAERSELAARDTVGHVAVDGRTYVVMSTPVAVGGEEWHVIAARNASEETTVLTQMRWLLVGGLALVVVGVGAGAWMLASVSLAPVNRLRESAEQLRASASSELLPVGAVDDEIARLARTLNDLIERLRAATERERQLVSDASHELRTPLAILNTRLELAASADLPSAALRADLEGARRDVARLSNLVSSLLELSAIDARGSSPNADDAAPPVSSFGDLEQEAADAADRARFRVNGGGIEVRYSSTAVEDAPRLDEPRFGVRADDFGRIVDNLTGNAVQAMGDSGVLEISVETTEAGLRLTVGDTGGGLDPAFVARALDRFSRADASRSDGSGVGLGLAIVDAIVRNAGGGVHLVNSPGEGLEVVVAIPAIASDAPSRAARQRA